MSAPHDAAPRDAARAATVTGDGAPARAAPPDPSLANSEIWLIRHAESVGNRDGLFQGQADMPLSPRGLDQAALLAARLRGQEFAALYCSDLGRAAHTARILAGAVGQVPVIDPLLREIDVGSWSGLSLEEIARRHPEQWASWHHYRDPAMRRGGGESYADLQRRVVPVVERIARAHPGGRVIAVAHGGTINAYLAHLLGLPLDQVWRLTQTNTAINRVLPFANATGDGTARSGRLLALNDAAHLGGFPIA